MLKIQTSLVVTKYVESRLALEVKNRSVEMLALVLRCERLECSFFVGDFVSLSPFDLCAHKLVMRAVRLTKKAEPPPTRSVGRDSGTDNAIGGWLRRLVRPKKRVTHNKTWQIIRCLLSNLN